MKSKIFISTLIATLFFMPMCFAEVKYNDFIPKDIRKILSDFYLYRVAFSKYYNSRYECQKLGEVV